MFQVLHFQTVKLPHPNYVLLLPDKDNDQIIDERKAEMATHSSMLYRENTPYVLKKHFILNRKDCSNLIL